MRQALAYCLSNPTMCMALEGIGAAAADRIGRRMARNRVEIEPGHAPAPETEPGNRNYGSWPDEPGLTPPSTRLRMEVQSYSP
eukprot:1488465-Rhodomonas_salina.4